MKRFPMIVAVGLVILLNSTPVPAWQDPAKSPDERAIDKLIVDWIAAHDETVTL